MSLTLTRNILNWILATTALVSVQADAEAEKLGIYLDCYVKHFVDPFDDSRTVLMSCRDDEWRSSVNVIYNDSESFVVGFRVKSEEISRRNEGEEVKIRYRFDKGDVREDQWKFVDRHRLLERDAFEEPYFDKREHEQDLKVLSMKKERTWLNEFLDSLANSEKLAIEVDGEVVTLNLLGSDKAVSDFRRRTKLDSVGAKATKEAEH